jgi:pimeloyl-ACP methyl ester carboxylesterase
MRFLRRFAVPREDVEHEREILMEVAGERRQATVYLPPGAPASPPGWVLLHGATVKGRHHDAVRRLARALAAAGGVVLVPEVPPWTSLRLAPAETAPAIRAGLAVLRSSLGADGKRLGLMAFSVVATWALEAAADLGAELRAVVGFGAYGDLERVVTAMIVGEHEWAGRQYRFRPDTYGRWIVAADLLPLLEDDAYGRREAREAAARSLRVLADVAGRHGAPARVPLYDPLIAGLRAQLPPAVWPAWDLLAAPSTNLVPDPEAGRALARALAHAGRRAHPELEPRQRLAALRVPTILVHGRADDLIPFTETLRLAALLPEGLPRRITITQVVGHTKTTEAARLWNPAVLGGELWRFARTMAAIVRAV